MDARSKGIDSRFSEDVKIVNKDLNKITFDNFKKKQDFLDGQNSIRYNIYRTVLFFEIYFNNNYGYFLSSEGINMSKTVVRKNESLDDALRRFKRSVSKAGTLQESRKREFYEKPSVRRKKKSEAARKRKKF